MTLPGTIDASKIAAKLTNGVLTVSLPKSESVKPRQIEVKVGEISVCDLQSSQSTLSTDAQYTIFHPSEIELSDTTTAILNEVERVRPNRVVFDSLSEVRLLARDSLRYRRQMLALKHYFATKGMTVLLLDTLARES